MDTNSTKNKKLHIFQRTLAFISRALFLSALFATVFSGIAAKQALIVSTEIGSNILTGDLTYLPEFKEYMGELIDNILLSYVGLEDGEISKQNANKFQRLFQQKLSMSSHDIIYYISTPDDGVHTNHWLFTEDKSGQLQLPTGYQCYFYWDGTKVIIGETPLFSDNSDKELDWEKLSQIRLIFGIQKNPMYYKVYMRNLHMKAQAYRFVIIYFISCLSATLILGLLCLISRKHVQSARAYYGLFSKKIWLEPKLLLLGLALWCLFAGYDWWRNFEGGFDSWPDFLWLLLLSGLFLYMLYADLLQNKAAVFTNSVPVKLYRFWKEYLQSEHWYRRIMRLYSVILVSAVLCAGAGIYLFTWDKYLPWIPLSARRGISFSFIGILLICMSACLFAIYRPIRNFTKDTKAVTDRLSDLQPGVPPKTLPLSANSPLQQTAEHINRLEYNIENAVEQRNRSNRLRVELITNVSHDLKTPLTSIINYADLLCEEELPEPAADYVVSLQKKAYRLRNMVQDVFELSKAASGNLRIVKQPLDLAKLIRQTLADMDERIVKSGLTFKTVIDTEPVMISADGEKLYRIFQNLFLNALQYSLENSRVHVQLSVKDGTAHTKIKNTSKEELNFDPSEIVERFVRADTSRTTEGSGLGLSIVQSFTEACGGTFHIDLDADMFTACVDFPLTEVPLPEDGASL